LQYCHKPFNYALKVASYGMRGIKPCHSANCPQQTGLPAACRLAGRLLAEHGQGLPGLPGLRWHSCRLHSLQLHS
jgi:hypothetical protein